MSVAPPNPYDVAAPLSAPLPGASPVQAVSRFFRKYATFSGRASLSEFWWWVLANAVVSTLLWIVMAALGFSRTTLDPVTGETLPGPLFGIGVALWVLWGLAVLVPSLALIWRRMHDTNRAGAFALLWFVPFVGGIIVIVFLLLPSDPAGARFD